MTLQLTGRDDGSAHELGIGERVWLALAENPTTGYRWTIEASDPQVIGLVLERFDAGSSMAPGAAGARVFEFEARARGQARVALRLWQAWSGESSVRARFGVMLRVR